MFTDWFRQFCNGIAAKLDFWALWGLAAQLAFTGRFVVQWIASEARRRSVIPLSFWYLSLVGSTGLLVYALVRRDPVFILGQSLGTVIYVRNLVLIYRRRGSRPLAGETVAAEAESGSRQDAS